MHGVRELLEPLALPPADPRPSGAYAFPAAHVLGAEMPQGHLHVWSGPPGAGKTAFLLGLLLCEARRGRTVLLASCDLSAQALVLRLLAMESGVPLHDLDAGRLTDAERADVARARARLEGLPLYFLEARGLTVASLEDRCVRAPRRVDVLGVDYVEAVVRPAGEPVAAAFRDLSLLAQKNWVAVVAVARSSPAERLAPGDRAAPGGLAADRVGWIEAGDATGTADARVVANRHGSTPCCRLRLEPTTARFVETRPEVPPATPPA
jgi:replicative DNA helicase